MPYYRNDYRGYSAMGGLMGTLTGYFIMMFVLISGYVSILAPCFWVASKIGYNYKEPMFWVYGLGFSYLLCCLVYYVKGRMIRNRKVTGKDQLFWKVLLYILILWAPIGYILLMFSVLLNGANLDGFIDFAIAIVIGLLSLFMTLRVFGPNHAHSKYIYKWAYAWGRGEYIQVSPIVKGVN